MDTQAPQDPRKPATLEDLDEAKISILKEMRDIVGAAVKLQDDDPSNDGPALLEIGQSIGAIAATVSVTAVGILHLVREAMEMLGQ